MPSAETTESGGTMLPAPAALRAMARDLRHAIGKVPDINLKRRLAAHALALAQVAEQIEREGPVDEFVRQANRERYKHLLAGALDERTRATVQSLLSEEQAVVDDKHRRTRQWRMRAEELRATAEQFQVPSARDTLLRAAANYDQLADQAEGRLTAYRSSPGKEAG